MAIVVSVLTGGSNNHETTSEEVNAFATDFVNEGIAGAVANTNGVAPATGGFAVNAQGTPDMAVDVSAGTAYVEATPTSQSSQVLRVKNSATEEVVISSNSSGSTKYDWLYISISATNAANPNTAADNVATLVTSRSSSASSDDGTPPTYGYPIAVITVANGATTITNANIRDIRSQVALETGTSMSESGWASLGFTPDTVTYNGNRSYDLVFNSTDLTDTVSPGMRLRTTRTVTAPTQCTDLESSSSQYWSRASGSLTGITFTDDFVVSAWVKLESYADMSLVSRYNGASGWTLDILSTGQVRLRGRNASSANFSDVLSYQSLPLNKWVHVAVQLDMSAFTATDTTSYIMIDGVNVPSAVSRSGTNPTALVQAGNLEIGASNGGTLPFDGKIAQVAIYSAKVTQANIRATIGQTLSGSETSLIGAWTFNGNGNDSDSNGNNLTAQGSATATNADSPFSLGADLVSGYTDGTTDFAIVTKTAFSTNTTLTVQVPEGCTIPTSGGVSAVAYSTQKSPYGFPQFTNVLAKSEIRATTTATTIAQLNGYSITFSLGTAREVRIVVEAPNVSVNGAASAFLEIWNGTVSSGTRLTQTRGYSAVSGAENNLSHSVSLYLAAGTYTINLGGGASSNTLSVSAGSTNPCSIYAEVVGGF